MSKRVVVTGMGIVSAIGNNVDEVFRSLKSGKAGLGSVTCFETHYRDEIPVAEVKLSRRDLQESLKPTPAKSVRTRASLMGIKAVAEALKSAAPSHDKHQRIGLISSTSVGGMDRTEFFFPDYLEDNNKGRIREVKGHDCASSTLDIADYFQIKDFATTISTACSSSANAIMLGARMIKNDMLDKVVVGGVDALTKFTVNGFNSLMILDRAPCRPFDDSRSGLNIGEGAAFLVIESEASAVKSGKKILAEVAGYGNACDAFHQTASSPEGIGPALAMEKALDVAGLKPEDISYVNVHGTGTPNNDLSEGKAMSKIFGNKLPPFSSTKQFTGHTLGAAGAIEAVISILSLNNAIIFPNLNFVTPMKELPLVPVTKLTENTQLTHVLSNSFGFGGNNTTLIFSKYQS